MRYRKLSPSGDYVFGQANSFHINTSEGVAQAIRTRLLLWAGEWFLDSQEGTDYSNGVLGFGTQGSRDAVIKQRILETPGVTQLLEYSSGVDNRVFSVYCKVDTAYSAPASATITIQR